MKPSILWSLQGRIRRLHFWLWSIVSLAMIAIGVGLDAIIWKYVYPEYAVGLFSIIGYASSTWSATALQVKRWHDRNKSGWWILISLVPVVGGLWALAETGFRKGTHGENQYGPDPLGT